MIQMEAIYFPPRHFLFELFLYMFFEECVGTANKVNSSVGLFSINASKRLTNPAICSLFYEKRRVFQTSGVFSFPSICRYSVFYFWISVIFFQPLFSSSGCFWVSFVFGSPKRKFFLVFGICAIVTIILSQPFFDFWFLPALCANFSNFFSIYFSPFRTIFILSGSRLWFAPMLGAFYIKQLKSFWGNPIFGSPLCSV